MTPSPSIPVIYLALPSQDGWVWRDSAKAALTQPSPKFQVFLCDGIPFGSLLGTNFNCEWAQALSMARQGEVTHFAMLHADIVPEENWLEILLEEMQASGAQVLSAVVSIKDRSGDSSTAIGGADDPWNVGRRLSLAEIEELPETFSIDDCGQPGQVLLVNSGCLLVDLRGGWAHETDAAGCLKTFFTVHDRVREDENGEYIISARSEDWNFSRMAAAAGCRVLATRKVRTDHFGVMRFPNRKQRGTPCAASGRRCREVPQ